MNGWNAGQGTGSNSALKKPGRPTKEQLEEAGMFEHQKKKTGSSDPFVKAKEYEDAPGKKNTSDDKIRGNNSDPFSKMSSFKKEDDKKKEFTWEDAIKNDPNLSNLVKERDSHKKGTDEYAAAQNRVNKAYQNAKRHNQETTSSTKKNPITGTTKTTETTTTPGLGTETTITKKDKKGEIIKQKTDTDHSDYVEETYGEEDSREKQKKGKDKEFGTDDDKKKKKKQWKDTKVGQFLGAGGKEARQERRKERKKKRSKKNQTMLKEDKVFEHEKDGKVWTQTGGFGEDDQSGKQVWEWVDKKNKKKKGSDFE